MSNTNDKQDIRNGPGPVESYPALRQWAFEKALALRISTDVAHDLIYIAAEIEAYIVEGKNPRANFIACVDVALAEVDHAAIAHVGEDKKRKVMECVRHWLKEYDIL